MEIQSPFSILGIRSFEIELFGSREKGFGYPTTDIFRLEESAAKDDKKHCNIKNIMKMRKRPRIEKKGQE